MKILVDSIEVRKLMMHGSKLLHDMRELDTTHPIINTFAHIYMSTDLVVVDDYNKLKADQRILKALYAAGVDNWDGFDYAQELLENNYDDQG